MNRRLILLVGSLVANVALALLLLQNPAPPPPPVENIPEATTVAAPLPAQRSEKKTVTNPVAPETPAFHWAQIESDDYKEYIARLRAFGVPERTVRDIIIADVQKLYRPKLAALRPKKSANTNFWENRNLGGPYAQLSSEQRAEMAALQKEQKNLVETLLGKNVYQEMASDSGMPDWTERMFGPLQPEQREKALAIQQRMQEAVQDLYIKAGYMIDQETQNEVRALRKKSREELATVLSPEQIEQYELRSSDVASNMRYQLGPFAPDEQEFRAVFRYKQAQEDLNPVRSFDDEPSRPTPDEMKARQLKQKEIDDALAQSLGPDRLKEFKLLDDGNYRNLFESGVPKESILKLADMKQSTEDAARRIRSDKSLTPQQRNEALQAVRAETEKELVTLLGERRAKAFPNSGGYWIRNLSPPMIR